MIRWCTRLVLPVCAVAYIDDYAAKDEAEKQLSDWQSKANDSWFG